MSPRPGNPSGLARAYEVRSERAKVKRALKSGRLTFAELLSDPPPCCAKVPTFDAVQWVHTVGPRAARKLIKGVVSETLPLCQVDAANRREIVERLHARSGARR